MSATPRWKVFDPEGNYQASTKEPEQAGVLAQWLGDGSTIRIGHSARHIVYTWRDENNHSWDDVSEACYENGGPR